MKKIKCSPEDCDNCPYSDCIGEIKKRPGRKALPPEVLKEHRRAYDRQYYLEHKEQHNAYYREYYRRKKYEKANNRNFDCGNFPDSFDCE